MSPLEDELSKLFRRKHPTKGFAERVMAALSEAHPQPAPPRRSYPLFRNRTLRWAAVAALGCVMAALGMARYQRQERIRAQAEQASREAIVALRITTIELNVTLEKAQRATARALMVAKDSKR